ncbi:MAG: response regulator [Phycisphaerae bacterium]|jgi:excisionase family DNA binding protein|nr:response regulator [Phycisphaerae bacterium]
MVDKREYANKQVFTTGEVAEICNVSQQTIIRCFDSGKLQGFRVPGSKFRRIPREALVQFMKENDIPLDLLDTGKRKILIVDDDPAITEMLQDVLERDGRFEVKATNTGYEAGILTQSFNPDLILLDYLLPDINGNIVCKTIRENSAFSHMKIIFVSGVVNPDEVEQLIKSGADDFIKKPFDVEKLISRITELLNI